ncbi:hypothetical protein ATK36_3490 [Amycolatopsis sulphurea]|uniref:Uncharacterized protein n=1 Tax=Amycolatopsis sulphurea TaxID=76022 RepID=A0A2A9FAN7_9PSEU|nr:hypothetical protein [Amycolatopsis sulphurea]PFG48404.1 hypothetical protein ATK36_3490 [Amycolatopsis sulphurea]
MRLGDTTSWRVYWGSDQGIDLALYLRDVLALPVAEGQLLPPVEPAVPVHVPPALDRASVQAGWPGWWNGLLEALRCRGESRVPRRRGIPSPGDGSAIDLAAQHFAQAAARHFADARRPAAFHRRQIVAGDRLGQLVRETELELGRRARPFRLSVLEIPVAGRVWLRTAEEQLLVSSRLAEDVPALEQAMRTLIRSLA